jgi:hypothetical protein
MRRAFWREYLRLFIFPLGGTTDFLGSFFKASYELYESPFVKMGKNQQKSTKISMMTTFLCFLVFSGYDALKKRPKKSVVPSSGNKMN